MGNEGNDKEKLYAESLKNFPNKFLQFNIIKSFLFHSFCFLLFRLRGEVLAVIVPTSQTLSQCFYSMGM